ncbi:MAG TPA: pirin family protein [Acidimicrobiales bacterium]|nr:pirin family protein [Acidimicrobiales bacterium]
MSGPVTTDDAAASPEQASPAARQVSLEPGRQTLVGELPVRRVLPRRPRRTVGAWCFADHIGPVPVSEEHGADIGPHPHMGLQTVTWLVSGELRHRDSLGSDQVIRPGQLNLMTAGHGVAHSEENTGSYRGDLQGIQLWVAQPESTRHGAPAFEHHADLPQLEFDGTRVTVLVGDFGGQASPARRDTDHLGADLVLSPPGTVLPLRPDCEYALIVLEGAVALGDQVAQPGVLAYLGTGGDECPLEVREPARALRIGGIPFPEPVLMWWNFVARTREEVSAARRQWAADDGRFGTVRSSLGRIDVGPPPWE